MQTTRSGRKAFSKCESRRAGDSEAGHAPTSQTPGAGGIVRVPADYSSVQAAIDAAADGDLVLVGPGTYLEHLTVTGKSVVLASHFHTTGDDSFIEQTIIDGQGSTTIAVRAVREH